MLVELIIVEDRIIYHRLHEVIVSKQPVVTYPDDSVYKLFKKVKARVLKDPDIVALLYQKP